MQSRYSFAAIRGVQSGRAYYVAMLPLKAVRSLLQSPVDGADGARRQSPRKVAVIAAELLNRDLSHLIPPIVVSVDGAFEFRSDDRSEAGGRRSVGTLDIEMRATISVIDGRTRAAAIARAVGVNPTLGDETVAVVVLGDEGVDGAEVLRDRLNRHRGSLRATAMAGRPKVVPMGAASAIFDGRMKKDADAEARRV